MSALLWTLPRGPSLKSLAPAWSVSTGAGPSLGHWGHWSGLGWVKPPAHQVKTPEPVLVQQLTNLNELAPFVLQSNVCPTSHYKMLRSLSQIYHHQSASGSALYTSLELYFSWWLPSSPQMLQQPGTQGPGVPSAWGSMMCAVQICVLLMPN